MDPAKLLSLSSCLGGLSARLTRSLREPGGPCTKSMKVSESRMEWVKRILHTRINIGCIKVTLLQGIDSCRNQKGTDWLRWLLAVFHQYENL